MDNKEKALALLGAVLSPGTTIASLGLNEVLKRVSPKTPQEQDWESSIFSRMIPPNESPTGKTEFLPDEVSEGAMWKKGSPQLPRLLKPETKLSPVTQQRLLEEMVRQVGATKDLNLKNKKGSVVMDLMGKLPVTQGKSVTGEEIQRIAKETGSQSHKAGEVNALKLLHNALANKSIYHGVKQPDGRNTLWQELYKPKKEATEVRNAMVDRRVAKNVATPEEKMEHDLRVTATKDPVEQMMESLRVLGKWPPKTGGGSSDEQIFKAYKGDHQLRSEFKSGGSPYAGFFSDRKDVAKYFADSLAKTFDDGRKGVVHSSEVVFKKPLVIDAKGDFAGNFQFGPKRKDFMKGFEGDYDGVILKNTKDEGTVYVPRNSNQIRKIKKEDE